MIFRPPPSAGTVLDRRRRARGQDPRDLIGDLGRIAADRLPVVQGGEGAGYVSVLREAGYLEARTEETLHGSPGVHLRPVPAIGLLTSESRQERQHWTSVAGSKALQLSTAIPRW